MKKKSGKKKYIWALVALVGLWASLVGPASAHTELLWDRNNDSPTVTDTVGYRVYACRTKGCVVTLSAVDLQPLVVAQPAVGVIPTWKLPVGVEGTVAVTAFDAANNESGLSVSIPFDSIPPSIPAGVKLR